MSRNQRVRGQIILEDNVRFYVESVKDPLGTNKFDKVARYKTNTKKQIEVPYVSIRQREIEFKMSNTTTLKSLRYGKIQQNICVKL